MLFYMYIEVRVTNNYKNVMANKLRIFNNIFNAGLLLINKRVFLMYNNLIRIPVYVFDYVGYEFSVNNKVIFYNFFYIHWIIFKYELYFFASKRLDFYPYFLWNQWTELILFLKNQLHIVLPSPTCIDTFIIRITDSEDFVTIVNGILFVKAFEKIRIVFWMCTFQ